MGDRRDIHCRDSGRPADAAGHAAHHERAISPLTCLTCPRTRNQEATVMQSASYQSFLGLLWWDLLSDLLSTLGGKARPAPSVTSKKLSRQLSRIRLSRLRPRKKWMGKQS